MDVRLEGVHFHSEGVETEQEGVKLSRKEWIFTWRELKLRGRDCIFTWREYTAIYIYMYVYIYIYIYRRGAPTRGHEARQRGTPPATTKARGQVPSHNGHRVPRTREARTTHDEPRHVTRCQGQPGPHARTPPHPQPVGSGPRQPAQRAGSRGRGSA